MQKITLYLKTMLDYLKLVFFDGLLIILPITLSIGLFAFSFRMLKKWLTPIYLLEPDYLKAIPHSEIILVITIIFFVGLGFRVFLMKRFLYFVEMLVYKLPLVNPVYSGIKQLVQAFTVPEKLTFQHVVLVEFPGTSGTYSIGFLTRKVIPEIAPDATKDYFGVFVPTTPNPTTGFFIVVSEEKFKILSISRQEAMSLIISGGIIQPGKK